MSQLLEQAQLMLDFHSGALEKLATQLTGDQWLRRLNGSSHAYWLLGHLAVCRRGLGRRLGLELAQAGWEKPFAKGGRPGDTMPITPADLLRDFRASGGQIQARLAEMDEAALLKPGPRAWPTGSDSVGGLVGFLVFFHEAYHLGQISLLCRSQGGAGLA